MVDQSPYHTVNSTIEKNVTDSELNDEASSGLANRVAATASDRAALAALTTIKEHLTAQLTTVTKSLTNVLSWIQHLETSLKQHSKPKASTPTNLNSNLLCFYC